MSGQQKFYITTPIFYPNGRAAYRPCLHGAGHRRHRALRAARRQGRVLPDRHRRARPQDEADGGRRGADAAGAGRPQLAALSRHDGGAQRRQRRLHPHHRAAALPRLGGDLAAHGARPATSTSTNTPAGIRCARRPTSTRRRRRSGADGVRARAAGLAGRVDRGGDLFLPPVRLSGPAARALREAPRFHPAARAAQRGGELRQGRA